MSLEEREPTCPACGLVLTEFSMNNKNESNLCAACTLNGTTEPVFISIVYAVAIGYFMNIKKLKDPEEAFHRAYEFVAQLPFWWDKIPPTPTLEELISARILKVLFTRMKMLKYDEKYREPSDFFISFRKEDKEILKPLFRILEEKGYNIWFNNKKKNFYNNKTTDWAKEGIRQSRHCVLILSKRYFECQNCTLELDIILTTRNTEHVFPIWWEDITTSFLELNKYGEKLLALGGIRWDEWKGDIENLVMELMKRVYTTEGFQKYNKASLVANEARILEKLERFLREPIPLLEKSKLDFHKETPSFGFYHENSHIIALFLENKRLRALPKGLGLARCVALKTLHLKNNFGMKIPTDVVSLKNLNLAQNHLTSLPDIIGDLDTLTKLDLSSNQLQTLPESFGNLMNLEYLDLSNNQLQTLPESFGDLSRLETLNLNNNHLKSLPVSFSNLKRLLTKKYPQVLESEATILFLLETLVGKPIPQVFQIKRSTFGFTVEEKRITGLGLPYQGLKYLPESLGTLRSLKKLYLIHNKLQALPESVGNLVNLQRLDLWVNKLQVLPETFGQLTQLSELNLRNNQLTFLPESFGCLKKLSDLDLSYNKLKALPESFFQLNSLRLLFLRDNQFELLPNTFGDLKSLKIVDLDNNQLRILPKTIGELINLVYLSLKNNQLKSLPKSFYQLINLRTLNLTQNQFECLSESINQLSSLRSLSLSSNQFKFLPEPVKRLKNLGCKIYWY
ncbi:MAG: leucine-rich repeat domain-containing protein [Candidatus Hermodarchaeota archaeon]